MIRIIRKLQQDQSGVTMIEYAMVLPVFLLFILGILEFSIVLFLRGSIEETTRSVARLGITGSTYESSDGRGDFLQAELTKRIKGVVFDDTAVQVKAQHYDTFNNFVNGVEVTSGEVFGSANHITRYTVQYNHRFLSPLPALVNDMDTTLLITSTVFAKNENF